MPGMMVSSLFWVPENDEETMDHSEADISEVEVEEYEVEVEDIEPIEPIEETVIEDSKEPVEDESEVQLLSGSWIPIRLYLRL